ncbi:hypothetical protein IQ244_12540 [Nostoc sp. LEGE 06077]|uniref:hypothetical protein n=1 Tax=Nostoc sp. LEGE 06077 TaxID=915325 RepID=UPI00188255F8|nr:hypothetical protein [Nostoc sp. LEGE 06077]MBE9207338.1 hypothetical protein [Nostoc sp. LEGE 06077]
MKNLILSSLSLLLISTAIAPAYGREKTVANSTALVSSEDFTTSIKPFNLVSLAYQGQLKNPGIPGYGSLLQAYETRQISAKDVVNSAFLANKLPSQFLNNREYINAVKNILDGFTRNNIIT